MALLNPLSSSAFCLLLLVKRGLCPENLMSALSISFDVSLFEMTMVENNL